MIYIADDELPQILRWLQGLGLKVRKVYRDGDDTIVEIVIR